MGERFGDGDAAFRDAFMAYLQDDDGIEIERLTVERASILASSMNDELDHRFSFSFKGGDLDGKNSVGDRHPTNIGDGE